MRERFEPLMNTPPQIAREKLAGLKHLNSTFDWIDGHPYEVARIFYDYALMFTRFFTLEEKEITVIQQVSDKIQKSPHKSAPLFRTNFEKDCNLICDTVFGIADSTSNIYQVAVADLTQRMISAMELKAQNLAPSDTDPRFANVIWGHVLGNAGTPSLDAYFIPAHLFERFLTARLMGTSLESFTTTKDWTFAVYDAVVGLDGVRNIGAAARLLPIWRLPRPLGLGWISYVEIDAYIEICKTNGLISK